MSNGLTLPQAIQDICEQGARHWNFDLSSNADLQKIAQSVQQLSDFFINEPEGTTPWEKTWAQQAYVFYYLPLNSLRVARVLQHIQKDLDAIDIQQVVDFGAGLATAARLLLSPRYRMHLIEQANAPQDLINKLDPQAKQYTWAKTAPSKAEIAAKPTLTCFSYSLTELLELPAWAWESRSLLIMEPSTQQDGRKLLQLREKLIAQGYHVLAPCTHQLECPLLHQSKSDWCHDRVHTQLPEWMQKMETHLPMKNRTLTVSYVFAVQKKFAPDASKTTLPSSQIARITGDLLKEKGKDRQLFCRGPQREFLAWMHKNGEHGEIPRGALIELPDNIVPVSNEWRVPAQTEIKLIES